MPTKVEIGSPQQDTHDSQRFTNHTRKGTQGMKDSEDSLDMPSLLEIQKKICLKTLIIIVKILTNQKYLVKKLKNQKYL